MVSGERKRVVVEEMLVPDDYYFLTFIFTWKHKEKVGFTKAEEEEKGSRQKKRKKKRGAGGL